jgi:hypothetical protein
MPPFELGEPSVPQDQAKLLVAGSIFLCGARAGCNVEADVRRLIPVGERWRLGMSLVTSATAGEAARLS